MKVAITSRALGLVVATIAVSAFLFFERAPASLGALSSAASRLSPVDDNSLEQQIVSKEREGLEDLKAGNVDGFARLTADDAVLVDAHGPAGKAQVVKNVSGFLLSEYSMEDIHFVRLSAHSGLIAYKIHEKGTSHGHTFEAQTYVSSIWAKQGKSWVCLFSQETSAK